MRQGVARLLAGGDGVGTLGVPRGTRGGQAAPRRRRCGPGWAPQLLRLLPRHDSDTAGALSASSSMICGSAGRLLQPCASAGPPGPPDSGTGGQHSQARQWSGLTPCLPGPGFQSALGGLATLGR